MHNMIPKEPVEIVEVGPRDGLQNISQYVETDQKIELIHLLAQSGLKEIEIGGFVHPKAIPQFQDISDVTKGLDDIKGVTFTALIPNLTGARNAIEAGIRKMHFVFSVSKSHNLSNARRTPDQSLEELKEIMILTSADAGLEISVDLATAFGCPFEIEVKRDDIMSYIHRVYDLGVRSMTLCDTAGYGNPRQVEDIFRLCMEHFPGVRFRAHFHDTRGLGLANVLAAYQTGIRSFDSSIGGLGGCPFAPGATGNVATEDLVFMFDEMGIENGVDVRGLFRVCRYLEKIIPDVPITSSLYRAGFPGDHQACTTS